MRKGVDATVAGEGVLDALTDSKVHADMAVPQMPIASNVPLPNTFHP